MWKQFMFDKAEHVMKINTQGVHELLGHYNKETIQKTLKICMSYAGELALIKARQMQM